MTPEPISEPTVRDRRVFPARLLSQHFKMVTLLGVAGLILVVIVTSGLREAPDVSVGSLAAAAGAAVNVNPEQVQNLEERLRVGLARGQQAAQIPTPAPVALPQPSRGGGSQAAAPASDVGREERQKKEYESLFSSNVVSTRRPPSETLAMGPTPAVTATAPPADDPIGAASPPLTVPTLDEVTRSVLRAMPQAAPVSAPQSVAQAPSPTVAAPVQGGHKVFEGTIIDAVLVNRLEGSFEGPVNALITSPVFSQDLALVIPAGARVLGLSTQVQQLDAARLAVAFHRIVLPDGRSISLNTFVGMNQRGDIGLAGQVNRHYLSTFGAAAAVGLISGLAQWVGSGFGAADRTVVIAGGIGDATSQATTQTMARFLNRLPTITIPEGARVKVYLTSDLHLPAYQGGGR